MDFLILVLIVALGSFGLIMLIMPKFIALLKSHDLFQEVSEYAIEEYKHKDKTPAMGGILFVVKLSIICHHRFLRRLIDYLI